MKQDIKFNVWVLISSVLQMLAGVVCLGAGAALGIMGFVSTNKLLKIKELNFFINQEGIIKLQKDLLGGILLSKYMYLTIGVIIAIVGIISLVFAIVEMMYVKRYKVVNRRVALIILSLIPLAIAGCVEAYLLLEYDVLKLEIDYIKNVRICCFAISGVFSACAIFKLLGVLFSKSEQFMSNDNDKYAFEGPKNGAKLPQGNQPVSRMPVNQVRNQSVNGVASVQNPQQGVRPASAQMRPNNIAQSANNQPLRPNAMARPAANPQTARPVVRPSMMQQPNNMPSQRPNQGVANGSVPSRVQRPMASRPAGNPNAQVRRPQPVPVRRCPKCGKSLMPNEVACTNCNKSNN